MNESYRLGEQSIITYLQRLANGVSTAELDVAALPAEPVSYTHLTLPTTSRV